MIFIALAQILILFVISYQVYRKQDEKLKKFFWPALVFKSICGVMLGLLYRYYYTGDDTFTYFSDASELARYARRDLWGYLTFLWDGETSNADINLLQSQPRALYFSKLTSIFCLVSGSNYWVVSLYFSCISFFSSWYLVRTLSRTFAVTQPAIVAFMFVPSIVFWTSGIVKETLAMTALFFLAGVFIKLYVRTTLRWYEWMIVPLAFWVLWNLKYYFVAVFLPVVSTMLVMKLVVQRLVPFHSKIVYSLIWAVIFFIPLYVASVVHPNFYPKRFLDVIVSNNDAFLALSDTHDAIHFENLEASPQSILLHMPQAVFGGLFRPMVWEASNILQYASAGENLMIILMTLLCFYYLIRDKKMIRSAQPLVVACFLYIVILAAFLTLSTPNFGTLSRFRVGFLPFYVFLIALPFPEWKKFNIQ